MSPSEFENWKVHMSIKDDGYDDGHIKELTKMIIEGRKEEEELAEALRKILKFVDEDEVRWVYHVTERTFSNVDERIGFLLAFGIGGWELCSEVTFHDELRGNCTRYSFKKRSN